MSLWTPAMSKAVGWDRNPIMEYPTLEEAKDFGPLNLCIAYRFLRSPETPKETETMNYIHKEVMEHEAIE